jgi:hypothetical protein
MPGIRLDLAASPSAGELRPRDIALAVVVSLAAHALVLVGARSAAGQAGAPSALEVMEEALIPVSVVDPAQEGPLLKLGGGRSQARTAAGRDPSPAPPQASQPERAAGASDKASKSAEDAPPPDPNSAPAGEAPPSLDPEVPAQTNAAPSPGAEDIASGAAGPGSPDGAPDGTETDPLKARAVDLYRARLIAWFSSRFRVSGSGLSPDELTRYKVSASVHLSSDRQIESFSIEASGNAAFDAAARAALEAARGQALPPPPESYPDIVQRTIRLTFVCRSDQCD